MTDYYALGKMDAHGVAPLKEAAARALLAGAGMGMGCLFYPSYAGDGEGSVCILGWAVSLKKKDICEMRIRVY